MSLADHFHPVKFHRIFIIATIEMMRNIIHDNPHKSRLNYCIIGNDADKIISKSLCLGYRIMRNDAIYINIF